MDEQKANRTRSEVTKVSKLRVVLESFAIDSFAREASKSPDNLEQTFASQFAQLSDSMLMMKSAVAGSDRSAFIKADYLLHQGLVKLADCPSLLSVWETVWQELAPFQSRTLQDCWPDLNFIYDEHDFLINSLVSGDFTTAKARLLLHLDAVWLQIRQGESEAPVRTRPEQQRPIDRAIAYISVHYSQKIILADLAKNVAFCSAGTLSRQFRTFEGMSFQQYLQNLRLEKAVELLSQTNLSVNAVSKQVGYSDPSRFAHHFTRKFDVGPSYYSQAT